MPDIIARSTFPKILRKYMDRDGFSQVDIAKQLKVSKQTVSDWLLGKKFPRVDRMQALAELFGVMMSDMYDPSADNSSDFSDLCPEEKRLLALWRGAEPSARQIAMETLANHQKKKSEQSAI